MLKRLSLGNTLPLGDTLPQFLASDCISGICEDHFLDNIFVSRKMVTANGSKPDTCQKLRQGGSAGAGGPLEAELLKLFPAAEGRVISRSFRKLFKGLRRARITRAARITSGKAVTC